MSIEPMIPDGGGVEQPADETVARIVDLGERREQREKAREGLFLAREGDAEAVAPAEVVEGTVIDPPDRVTGGLDWLDERTVPILPGWLLDPQTRRDVMRRAVRAAGYRAGVHAVRTPFYAVRWSWWAMRGVVKVVAGSLLWAAAETGNWSLRQDAASRNDAATWMALDKHRQRQSTWRWWVVTGGAVGAAAGGAALVLVAPWWVEFPVGAGALAGLIRAGKPAGKTMLERTRTQRHYRKLTADLVRRGIMATNLVKRPEDIMFPREIMPVGPGYEAIIDLPDGVIAVDVVDRRAQLAGGLRLPVDQVWPETIRGEHPGRLALWVADKPVSSIKPPAWPLLRAGKADYFDKIPYGFDPRQRPVWYRLDERNSLFAGFPGSGKSLAVRVVMCGASQDRSVRFVVFELKGSGDFDAFEPLCPDGMYGSGADDSTKEQAKRGLAWLLKEIERRGPLIKKYAKAGLADNNKLTRAMVDKDPSLYPILAVFDEVQELFADDKEAVEMATSVIKLGRAMGIHLILATQRIDKESIPKGISSNVSIRTCLAVPSHVECDLVLGTGAYRQGARPTQFEPGEDSGWGVRAGLGPMVTARSYYLDNNAVERICRRAVELRGGQTLDLTDLPPARDLLADLQAVWVAGEAGQHYATLATRLTERYPERYPALNEEALSAMVRAAGLTSRQVKIQRVNRNGVFFKQITDALADRAEQTD